VLRSNIIANYFGVGWAALLGLVTVPLYVRYLGIESYALVGVMALLQVWLFQLDVGLSPMINRELARYRAGALDIQSVQNLVRTVEVICVGLALVMLLLGGSLADFLAADWLKAEALPTETVSRAIGIMAGVIALQFIESIYRGALLGLQNQVQYNVAHGLMATLRHGGAVCVVALLSPTIEAFLVWNALVALLRVILFAILVHRQLPSSPARAAFSTQTISRVWRFSAGMMGISVLALLLTQVDKVLLSRLLTLREYGVYVLVTTAVGVLSLLATPLVQAIYPRLVELVAQERKQDLAELYHLGSQAIVLLSAPTAVVLSLFSKGVLFAWTGNVELAVAGEEILSVLVWGTLLNTLMWMPYKSMLAHGWTSLSFWVNIAAVLVLIPAIIVVVPHFGAVGAAWVWLSLNGGYLLITVPLMHRRILKGEMPVWYMLDTIAPLVAAAIMAGVASFFAPKGLESRITWGTFLVAVACLSFLAALSTVRRSREAVYNALRSALKTR
jgi:O-antigen/teichoic acid export membrane protein